MKKITSFTIDHTKLLPGLYVSRKDTIGDEVVTTFDLRLCKPNSGTELGTAEIHTIEHIAATHLRNDREWGNKIIYFGPMGCRTGFYFIAAGDYNSLDVWPLVCECFEYISHYDDYIPGASLKECGNYLDLDLSLARVCAKNYLEVLRDINVKQLVYPG